MLYVSRSKKDKTVTVRFHPNELRAIKKGLELCVANKNIHPGVGNFDIRFIAELLGDYADIAESKEGNV